MTSTALHPRAMDGLNGLDALGRHVGVRRRAVGWQPRGVRGASLVAVAHGSSDPRAAETVHALLAGVRRSAPGLSVSAAFLDHTEPSVPEALYAACDAGPEVVVLPLLLTAGYHSRVDIPRAVAGARAAMGAGARPEERTIRYAAPLGPHPLLVAGLERRLSVAGVAPGDPETAVVLVAAGSSDPRAKATVEGVAAGWRGRGWWDVRAAYACAAGPTVSEAVNDLRRSGAPRIAVAPYLLSPGLLPDRVATAARAAGADVVADVLGPAPELVELVLARMTAAPALS